MRTLIIINSVLLIVFLGLTIALSQILPGAIKSAEASEAELNQVNGLVAVREQLTQFQKQRKAGEEKLAPLKDVLAAITALGAKHQVSVTTGQTDTRLSLPARFEQAVPITASATSITTIQAFLSDIPRTTERVFVRNLTVRSQPNQTVEATINLIIFAK
jgi:hypothetical protein